MPEQTAVVETGNNRQPYQNQMMSFMPQDPISMFFMGPIIPLLLLMNAMQSMTMMPAMARPYDVGQARTKVTSITRTGNTLDIIEKWV